MSWFKFVLASSLVALCSACASTKPLVDTNVTIHFPPSDPITSVEQADSVLDDVTLARSQIDWRFKQKEQICYDRFFVNSCLIDAKKERHDDLAVVKKSEVAANYFKRKNNVEEMDRALVEKNLAHPLPDQTPNTTTSPNADQVTPADSTNAIK